MVLPRVREVPTGSGATGVQVLWRYRNNKPELTHVGSAHGDEELAVLHVRAQRIIDDAFPTLDVEVDLRKPENTGSAQDPLPVVGWRCGVLLDVLEHTYRDIGLDRVGGGLPGVGLSR